MHVDAFLADAVASSRAARGGTSPGKDAEDLLTLLTDYRLSDIDERGFERLLEGMKQGRSPVTLLGSAPQSIAAELLDRWQAYQQQNAPSARR